MTPHPEHRESLWMLAASPTIWAAHFLLCYATAAVWCAKVGGALGGGTGGELGSGAGGGLEDAPAAMLGGGLLTSFGSVRVAVAAYTIVALIGIGVVGWRGLSRHRRGGADVPHEEDRPEDRHGFMGFATLLLSALSLVAIIFVALTAVFIDSCY